VGIVIVIAGLVGCSAQHQTSHTPDGGSVSPVSPVSPPATPIAAVAASFCSVPNPSVLAQAETTGVIAHGPGEDLAPTAVAPDGSSYFAVAGHGASAMNDLLWIRDHGRRRQKVYTLASPYPRYGLMGFDGRWLIFMADKSTDLTGAWDLYAWDTQAGGAPKVIASDPGDGSNSPVEWPRVAAGKATWVQGLADGTDQVHVFDLAADHDKVVHTGHVGASMFAGDLVVWTEVLQENASVTLAAASSATGAPAALPAPLAAARTAPAAIASDGTTWAWVSADFKTLYAWRSGMPAAVTVRAVDQSDSVDEPGVTGDVVTWTGAQATYAADLKTHSYTRITAQYGSALVNGSAIAVYYPQGDLKAPDMTYDGYVLEPQVFSSLAACRA
jgi:hypothetical protein